MGRESRARKLAKEVDITYPWSGAGRHFKQWYTRYLKPLGAHMGSSHMKGTMLVYKNKKRGF